MKLINALRRRLADESGFTFMEIMIAVTIIAIFVVLVGPRLMDLPKKAQVTKCKQEMSNLSMALEQYYLDNASYPTTEQGLISLVQMPTIEPLPKNWNENGYLNTKKEPTDAWGRAYIYRSPGEEGRSFEIISLGVDGKEGGSGFNADIRHWEMN